ncbi:PTS system transporter subunit IID [Streptococcus pneumoniae]|nr:PTS system transporter subunit IID [Streptococcus pneumoniae]
MTGSNKLTKRDYLKTSLRAFFCQNGFNYSNYQGLGYVCAAYLNIPTIGIAIVGTIFALIEFS